MVKIKGIQSFTTSLTLRCSKDLLPSETDLKGEKAKLFKISGNDLKSTNQLRIYYNTVRIERVLGI